MSKSVQEWPREFRGRVLRVARVSEHILLLRLGLPVHLVGVLTGLELRLVGVLTEEEMTGVCLLCLLCGDSSTGLSPNLYSLSLGAFGAQPSNWRTRSVTRLPPEFFVTGGSSLYVCRIYLGLSCLLICVIVFRLLLVVTFSIMSTPLD